MGLYEQDKIKLKKLKKKKNSLKVVSIMTFRYEEKNPKWALQWKRRIVHKNHKNISLKDMPKMVAEIISWKKKGKITFFSRTLNYRISTTRKIQETITSTQATVQSILHSIFLRISQYRRKSDNNSIHHSIKIKMT